MPSANTGLAISESFPLAEQEAEGIATRHRAERVGTLSDFDLLTLADAAKLLRCSKAHVGKAVAGHIPGCPPIPAVSLGRRKLIRRASLLLWLESNEQLAISGTIRSSPEGRAGRRA